MIKKYILVIAIMALESLSLSAITDEQFCSPSHNSPLKIKEMRPMSDGITYSAISEDGKSIEIYDYKTGTKKSTLFSISTIKGDLKIDSFDGYQISSNEKKILIWNDVQPIYRHSFNAEYYVYDIMRETLKKVSEKGIQRGAVISHDGRMVAYTRENNIFISNLEYGTDNQITTDGKHNEIINGVPDWSYEEEFGVVNTIRWSGDDTVLAYVKFNEKDVRMYSFDNYKSYCVGDPLSDIYPNSYTYKYPLAGSVNTKVDLYAYNLDNRTTKKMDLSIGDQYIPSVEFDGEGKNLMVMLLNRNQNDLRLYKVNPASTVGKIVWSEKSNTWISRGVYDLINYQPQSFIVASDKTGYRHLYEYSYAGTLLRTLTAGEWNVTAYYGKNTKNGIHYFQSTQLGSANRNVASVDTKGIIKILNNKPGTESASFSRGMDYFVRSYSNVTTPTQFTICTAAGILIKQLQMNETYAKIYESGPKKELLKVKNAEGKEMNAYVIKPGNFDSSKKYPLLMYQYNGPESQETANRWKMDGLYYLASQGYIIACVDGRGTGYRSREWATSVYRNLGNYETEDQIAGARELSKLSYIDASRMACFGWSYGGYMTLMEMTATDSPFKCGIAMAPVTDWRFYDSIYTERYMSTPQENENGYANSSALGRTKNLKGRLLIMSGTSDDNVHLYNTLKYTSKLNYEGKIFDMMALTGFEHSLPYCNARLMLYRKIADFLSKEL